MQINSYLKRINYKGELSPSLNVLKALQSAHLLNIPFENLDIHYGRKIELDLDEIFTKVMNNNRGGFCYELNGLFYQLLRALDFEVKMISAMVHNGEAFGGEYDHLTLIVTIDGEEYLTEVGFGRFCSAPLPLKPDFIHEDHRGKYRIKKHDIDNWLVEYEKDLDWATCVYFHESGKSLSRI